MSAKSFTAALFKKVILPAAIIGGAAAVFMYMKNTKPAVPAEPIQEKAWAVSTFAVDITNASPELTLYGAVEASETVKLSATVNAYVDQVNVAKGDNVKQGQTLITLDDRELKLTLAQRQASLQDIEARIASEINRNATDEKSLAIEEKLQGLNVKNLERQQELVANNMAPASRLEDASKVVHQQQLSLLNRQNNLNDHPNRLAQLQASAAQSQAQLDFAELDLERTVISAPFDGRILNVNTAVGNRARNGDQVVTLYNTQNLEVRSQIPARYLPYLQTGAALTANLEHNGKDYQLQLERLSAEASNSQGGIDAFFNLPAKTNLEVGRNVQLILALPEETNVAAIPALALYGQNRVYRIVDNRLQAVLVERLGEIRGPNGAPMTLIRSTDLDNDDLLITTQLPNAVTGLLVELN